MSFILSLSPKNKLYIGSFSSASSKAFVLQNQIKQIVNCSIECPNYHEDTPEVKYLHVPIKDDEKENVLKYFESVIKFVLEGIKQTKEEQENILIHCQFGVSRSATVGIAIIMALSGLSLQRTQYVVQIRRPEVNPNLGFIEQLKKFEEFLTTNQQLIQQEEQKENSLVGIREFINKQETELQCNYRCKKCRTDLFKSIDVAHGLGLQTSHCMNYFIMAPQWLSADHLQSNDGKLDCFKCHAKLGDYKLSGMKCTCGEWIAPAYNIIKFKTDRKVFDSEKKQWI